MYQHLLYNRVYVKIFNNFRTLPWAIGASIFDSMVHVPLMCLPSYFGFKSMLTGGTFFEGMRSYVDHGWETLQAYWKIWIPAQIITFGLVPLAFRIAWIASVSLVWHVILSFTQPMTAENIVEKEKVISEVLRDMTADNLILEKDNVIGEVLIESPLARPLKA